MPVVRESSHLGPPVLTAAFSPKEKRIVWPRAAPGALSDHDWVGQAGQFVNHPQLRRAYGGSSRWRACS